MASLTDSGMPRMKRSVKQDAGMPIVFIPEESDKECIARNRMSSFGFLGSIREHVKKNLHSVN